MTVTSVCSFASGAVPRQSLHLFFQLRQVVSPLASFQVAYSLLPCLVHTLIPPLSMFKAKDPHRPPPTSNLLCLNLQVRSKLFVFLNPHLSRTKKPQLVWGQLRKRKEMLNNAHYCSQNDLSISLLNSFTFCFSFIKWKAGERARQEESVVDK